MTDSDRESLIDAAYDQMIAASDESIQRQHWRDMLYHIRLRSPEQILKMETERRIGEKFARLFTYDMGTPANSRSDDEGHGTLSVTL
ncbi:hypothetical protein [Bradyrhizobium sp.]